MAQELTTTPGATQRFIPFRRRDLVGMLADEGRLTGRDQEEFGAFAELLSAVFHHEFHGRLEDLKDAYAPFDPGPDTRLVRTARVVLPARQRRQDHDHDKAEAAEQEWARPRSSRRPCRVGHGLV